jgi:hypothetical protein
MLGNHRETPAGTQFAATGRSRIDEQGAPTFGEFVGATGLNAMPSRVTHLGSLRLAAAQARDPIDMDFGLSPMIFAPAPSKVMPHS